MIYFDNAATTKMIDASLNELLEKTRDCFGNPSTKYSVGLRAKRAMEDSRKMIASLLDCNKSDLFFTSGGTEGNNIIVQSILRDLDNPVNVITSSIEHASVLNVLSKYNDNVSVTYIKPDKNGRIDPNKIELAIKPNTKLILVQYINNELGTIEPIDDISSIALKHGIHFHVDAVQAVGHIPLSIAKSGMTSLSASAHKFGGPKGIGFIYSKNHDVALCFGGGQESGVKSGTENVPAISSMAVALAESCTNLDSKMNHISSLVSFLEKELKQIDGVSLNASLNEYHSIINFHIDGVSNEALVNYLDIHGVCVSTGSACSGNSIDRSHVLKEIGLSDSVIDESIRISLSCYNSIEECGVFLSILKDGIMKLRKNK